MDPERLCEFWAAVTGYERRPSSGSRLGLRDPSGRRPSLTFQRCDTADPSPTRCHVDFHAGDPDDVAERALQLGAEFVRRVSEGDVRWVVLADPDGNEFCVVASASPDQVSSADHYLTPELMGCRLIPPAPPRSDVSERFWPGVSY